MVRNLGASQGATLCGLFGVKAVSSCQADVMPRHVRNADSPESAWVKIHREPVDWTKWASVGRFLRCVLLVGFLIGSLPLAASGPAWGEWGLAGLYLDWLVLMPLLVVGLRRRGVQTGRSFLLIVIPLGWIIASVWLWSAIHTLSGSWIWPTAVVPIVAYLTFDYAVWRSRTSMERKKAAPAGGQEKPRTATRPRGAWSTPTARDYVAALGSPRRWLYPTTVVLALAALPAFLVSLIFGYWSFAPVAGPAGAAFLMSLRRIAGNNAWKRTRPPKISVRDLVE